MPRVSLLFCLLLVLVWPLASSGIDVTVEVLDVEGQPLNQIGVIVRNGKTAEMAAKPHSITAIMDQVNREFVPHTLIVQQGTSISFPNSDSIQHHVYSFSAAKTFELKLYSQLAADPMIFDKTGIVELGCNIHDWMLGYINIVNTPYFAQTTDNGKTSIDIPAGNYELQLWHPRLGATDRNKKIAMSVSENPSLITITLSESLFPSLVEYDAVEGFQEYD